MIRNKPSQKGCYNYWTSLCGVINLFSRNQLAWSSEPQAGSQSDMWSNVRSFTEVSSVLWYALAGHLSKHKCRSCTLAQISNQCRRVWHDWRLVWVIQKPRISWGFCTPPSLGFERNGLKKRTFPVSESRPCWYQRSEESEMTGRKQSLITAGYCRVPSLNAPQAEPSNTWATPHRVPLLSGRNRKLRLEFTQAH